MIASAVNLPKVKFDLSIVPLLEADPEEKRAVAEFEAELPTRHAQAIVVLEWPRRLDARALEILTAVGERLQSMDIHVRSLATINVGEFKDGFLDSHPFRDTVVDGKVAEMALSHPLLVGTLVSQDGRSAAMILSGNVHDDRLDAIDDRRRWNTRRATGS